MEEKFHEFFADPRYIKIKNSLFNYKNRVHQIKKIFYSYSQKTDQVKALDIGSGISPVSPVPKQTVFADLSSHAVKFLEKEGFDSIEASITNLPYKDNSFTWVFCSEVLEHVKDYQKAIEEVYRVLNNNGKFLITVPVWKKYWDMDDEFVKHYRRFNPFVLKEELEQAGFKILKMKPIGGFLERKLTSSIVRIFKKGGADKMNDFKMNFIILVNLFLFELVRSSLLFSSDQNTSIMLYVCEKNQK